MQRLEVSGAVRPLYGSLGVKGLSDAYLRPVPLYHIFTHYLINGTIFEKKKVIEPFVKQLFGYIPFGYIPFGYIPFPSATL